MRKINKHGECRHATKPTKQKATKAKKPETKGYKRFKSIYNIQRQKSQEASQESQRNIPNQKTPLQKSNQAPPLTSKYLTFTRYSQEKKSKTLTPRCSSPTASEPRNFGEASTRSSGENLLNVENTGPSSKSRKLIHPWSGS